MSRITREAIQHVSRHFHSCKSDALDTNRSRAERLKALGAMIGDRLELSRRIKEASNSGPVRDEGLALEQQMLLEIERVRGLLRRK